MSRRYTSFAGGASLLLLLLASRAAHGFLIPPPRQQSTAPSNTVSRRGPTFLTRPDGDTPGRLPGGDVGVGRSVSPLPGTASAQEEGGGKEKVEAEAAAAGKTKEEEEEHPKDMASTTPQLLAALWSLIATGKDMVRGDSSTLLFPNMEEQLSSSYLSRLLGHFDVCKDVCDDFGVNTVLVPLASSNQKVIGFTVKSYRNPAVAGEGEDDEYNFSPDPFWDDDEDWSGIALGLEDEDDEGEGADGEKEEPYPEIINRIPDNDDEIIEVSRAWVSKVMSDMGICPFTSGADLSGMPMGKVLYEVDRATRVEDVYASYWDMVVRVDSNDEKELSTTLQILPDFCMDNIEMFENFSNTLTQPLESLDVEKLLQLVFFHPEWTFRDGGERSGIGAAANYARRSPWPMINILRTNQVRAAQKGIPTGLVYQQNEKTLNSVGTRKLETMLRKRDWSDIEDLKVNRRDMEALRIAQDYKETGEIAEEDRNVVHDSTPAANKVDSSQVEGGDMVNVIIQAIEKRLGVGAAGAAAAGDENGKVQRLSGAETSAAMMASDFLLAHLEMMEATGAGGGAEEAKARPQSPSASETNEDDIRREEDEEMSVLVGDKGITEDGDKDEGKSKSSTFWP